MKSYTVILTHSGDSKVKMVKTLRSITGLGLKEVQYLYDNTPCVVMEGGGLNHSIEISCLIFSAGGACKRVKIAGGIEMKELLNPFKWPSIIAAVLIYCWDWLLTLCSLVREGKAENEKAIAFTEGESVGITKGIEVGRVRGYAEGTEDGKAIAIFDQDYGALSKVEEPSEDDDDDDTFPPPVPAGINVIDSKGADHDLPY